MWGNMQGILFIFEGFGRSIMIFLNQVTDAYYICLLRVYIFVYFIFSIYMYVYTLLS